MEKWVAGYELPKRSGAKVSQLCQVSRSEEEFTERELHENKDTLETGGEAVVNKD